MLAGVDALSLDPRYSDADGDLIADIPTDPKEWVDPAAGRWVGPSSATSLVARLLGSDADRVRIFPLDGLPAS